MITPDLQQNIVTTIYLLFSHNYVPIAYFAGMVIGIGLSIYKPSRFATFIMLGFAILLFGYEYDKHIISGLREQTMKSLITEKPHYRIQRLVDIFTSEILPMLFYLTGWGFLFLGIILQGIKEGKKSPKS
jgi:hypothetical protein